MKMICAPSQVMREGRDLNQHGHAGRHEQASSSSPLTFQEVLAAFVAASTLFGAAARAIAKKIANERTDLLEMTGFISLIVAFPVDGVRQHNRRGASAVNSEFSPSFGA